MSALVAAALVTTAVPSMASATEPTPGTDPDAGQTRTMSAAGVGDGLQMTVNERGRISSSVAGAAGGSLTVTKPLGAEVRSAYLAYATTGFSATPMTSPLTMARSAVPLTNEVTSGISSYNYFADVTSIVKPVVDAAPPGTVTLPLVEPDPDLTEGEILVVVYDDPAVTTDQTVSVLYGALAPSGDSYGVRLARPIDLADPATKLQMSLGISFGYQAYGTPQYSTVDVNGRRLTTAAGGDDDGYPANGSLITVGGEGDSADNPADPNATPADDRSDDELYDLRPFVHDGDDTITVQTTNPSRDDNVFLAVFEMNPPVVTIETGDDTLQLSPQYQEAPTGETVSIEVGPLALNPFPTYRARVLSGPNAGDPVGFECRDINCGLQVDAAAFAYWGSVTALPGDDLVEIWDDANNNGFLDASEPSGSVTVRWNAAVNAVGMGDSYSSGEGLDPYDEGTDDDWGANRNQCHRSAYAYAHATQPVGYAAPLATYVGGRSGTTLDFIACAGAKTVNLNYDGETQYDEPATQLDQGKLNRGTDLVTLTIGGNDIGFVPVLKKCALRNCMKTSARVDGIWVQDWAQAKLDELGSNLRDTMSDLRSAAPNASVILAGYPKLFPEGDARASCLKLAPFNDGEQDWLNSIAGQLDAAMGRAAAEAGVHYLSVLDQFAGHSVCGPDGEWVAGLTAANPFDFGHKQFVGSGSFHPNQSGQRLGYAALINEFLAAGRAAYGTNDAGLPRNPEPQVALSASMVTAEGTVTVEGPGDLGDLYLLHAEADPEKGCLPENVFRPGATAWVAGEGFAPGSTVTLSWDRSTDDVAVVPTVLGTTVADESGDVAAMLTLPAADAGSVALVTADGVMRDGRSLQLIAMAALVAGCDGTYSFGGFYAPVDNAPTANVVKAGSAVPVKFSLGSNQGLDVFADGSPSSALISCDPLAGFDDVEEAVTAGSSSLSYAAGDDRYTYVWKTRDAWEGTCRRLTLSFGDGSSHSAVFQFR